MPIVACTVCLLCGGCNSCRKGEEGCVCTCNKLVERVTAALSERQTDLLHIRTCV